MAVGRRAPALEIGAGSVHWWPCCQLIFWVKPNIVARWPLCVPVRCRCLHGQIGCVSGCLALSRWRVHLRRVGRGCLERHHGWCRPPCRFWRYGNMAGIQLKTVSSLSTRTIIYWRGSARTEAGITARRGRLGTTELRIPRRQVSHFWHCAAQAVQPWSGALLGQSGSSATAKPSKVPAGCAWLCLRMAGLHPLKPRHGYR